MSKKYLAFKDDLTKIANSDLVIKEGSATLLADETLGTTIYIPEYVSNVETNVEYILVEKYQAPNSEDLVITVLRKDLLSVYNKWWEATHYLSDAQGFITNFDTDISNNFCAKTMNNGNFTGSKIFPPSAKEMTNSGKNTNDGYTAWNGYLENAIAKYNGTAQAYWMRDAESSYVYYITSSGGLSAMPTSNKAYVRPAIALYGDARIDSNNVLTAYGKTYSGNIESVQDGNSYYRIKDTRLPNGSNANDVLQWTNGEWTSSALSIPTEGDIASGDTGYATGGDVYAALEDKADTSDVPVAGTIAEGETGYATGGDVFTAINIPDLEIVELCAESPFSNMVAIGDDYLGTDSDTVLSL